MGVALLLPNGTNSCNGTNAGGGENWRPSWPRQCSTPSGSLAVAETLQLLHRTKCSLPIANTAGQSRPRETRWLQKECVHPGCGSSCGQTCGLAFVRCAQARIIPINDYRPTTSFACTFSSHLPFFFLSFPGCHPALRLSFASLRSAPLPFAQSVYRRTLSCGLPRNLRGTPLTDKRDLELHAHPATLPVRDMQHELPVKALDRLLWHLQTSLQS